MRQANRQQHLPPGDHYVEPTAFGNWIRSPGVRETVESILIAIVLALLFRYFEAEAYVIPTGSMAPDLQGQHIDVACPECQYNYRAGASGDNPQVRRVACPLCQYPLALKRAERRDHRPYSGDRILVNKFAYDFNEPERWDVIVFKYPNNGKQNFIKRLIGLPNEGILIERGDIYAFDRRTETFKDRKICRKSPRKLKAMLQMVDDTDHLSTTLLTVGWPSRWQQWNVAEDSEPNWRISNELNKFSLENSSEATDWLRYRHLRPLKADWEKHLNLREPARPPRFKDGIPPGRLVTDHYAYNDTPARGNDNFSPYVGLHWVGDLAIQANVQVNSGQGNLIFELVEGVVRYQCTIDVSSGQATFGVAGAGGGSVKLEGEAKHETPVKGKGAHEILFANADDKLFLWIDDKYVGGCEFSRSGEVFPYYSKNDPADAEPVGVGGQNVSVEISRLRVLRDIYYTSKNLTAEMGTRIGEMPGIEYKGGDYRPERIHEKLRTPAEWKSPAVQKMFASRARDESYVFPLEEGQLLPMGDNSPQSNDARIWDGARFIDESYLLGEALLIYWPHAKSSPLPIWPNFEQMKFIR